MHTTANAPTTGWIPCMRDSDRVQVASINAVFDAWVTVARAYIIKELWRAGGSLRAGD